MTQIQWTKCSEQMPHRNIRIIVKSLTDKPFICCAHKLHEYKDELCRSSGTDTFFTGEEFSWTPYTTEAWNEVNR